MGGRMLNDCDLLFEEGLKEPVIFNMTVRMVGGLQRNSTQELKETQFITEQPIKRLRTDTKHLSCYEKQTIKEGKGKQKQSRKRKYNDA
ncbi:hypothetical protein G6F57_009690 [Rhizopus arrhizus]|uniref:Uncharacterized protein n=1 Tax=Rhizopus oryzae TaxID=64495 RepID=A0A9P6XDG2_RHIOR|nr:hypothetical protein G6F23_008014 [Rhizopus arrhizus]KAG1416666.1 hypothetical protein G6F58_005866 [Rhizopus delemar]KAG0767067.1 hypothetical protein G6F24_003095 [Rhizopus arrhizus]KAG0789300.1 hypothetical protein G6F22_006747 [Rhizopus arrhizus]KAG0794917.1 hypothetical protein G6F21_002499 [Rhizopus arrhizus]